MLENNTILLNSLLIVLIPFCSLLLFSLFNKVFFKLNVVLILFSLSMILEFCVLFITNLGRNSGFTNIEESSVFLSELVKIALIMFCFLKLLNGSSEILKYVFFISPGFAIMDSFNIYVENKIDNTLLLIVNIVLILLMNIITIYTLTIAGYLLLSNKKIMFISIFGASTISIVVHSVFINFLSVNSFVIPALLSIVFFLLGLLLFNNGNKEERKSK